MRKARCGHTGVQQTAQLILNAYSETRKGGPRKGSRAHLAAPSKNLFHSTGPSSRRAAHPKALASADAMKAQHNRQTPPPWGGEVTVRNTAYRPIRPDLTAADVRSD